MTNTHTPLVGRERHLRELRVLVDSVAAENAYAVVLSGEAGAGKTTLAEESALVARAAGVHVAWATCWRNAAAPLSVWRDVVAAAAGVSAIPQEQDRETDPESARARWVLALAHQLVDAIADRPTLVIIDDLQWADPLSQHAIEVFVSLTRSSAIGLLCTVRDDSEPSAERVDHILRTSRHLIVSPLTQSELATLAADLIGQQLAPAALSRLHDRTGGNVLFARELLRHAASDPLLGNRERLPSSSATIAIFSERLAVLSPQCQRVLHAASVIGRRFRLDILAEALETDAGALLEDLGEADAAGLVRSPGLGEFEFSHPLVAEACYLTGGLPQRIRLHRDVAEAMERMRARGLVIPAVEIAHHFVNAAAAGVAAKAAEYAAIAGREDMDQLAYEDAVRDFGLALRAAELCPVDDSMRAHLLLELGDAHAATGDRTAARANYETVARLARQHDWQDLFARAALGVGSGPGGFEVPPFDDHQVALLEEAAAITGGPWRAQVLARLSVALALDSRAVARRRALSQEAISLASAAADRVALGYALASWCDVIPGPDAGDERLVAAEEIVRCGVDVNDTPLELLGRRLRVVALLEAGRIDAFDAEVAAYAASSERLGQPAYSWYVPLWHAMRAAMEGRFDSADRLRATAESIGTAAHSDNAVMLTSSQWAMLSCELRDAEATVALFERFLDEFPDYAIMVRPGLAYSLAASGRNERAREIVVAFDPDDYTVDALGSEFLTTLLMVAHAGWLAGCDDHATRLYDALVPYRSRFAIDGIGGYFVGSIERTLGVLAAQRNDVAAARSHFTVALEQHRHVRSPVLVAGTLRDAGLCLHDEEMIRDANAMFASLGVTTAEDPSPAKASPPPCHVFRREGELWFITWNGRISHLRHTKGMGDLARLLAQPGIEMHVLDLVDAGPTVDTGTPGDPIDATARDKYRERLEDIESDLAEADANADVVRAERLHLERDALIAELTAAYGLGGRARRRGDSSERARSAVTQRIRDAITRITRVDPDLGTHFRRAIRTGTFCAYEPETPVAWELSPVTPPEVTP